MIRLNILQPPRKNRFFSRLINLILSTFSSLCLISFKGEKHLPYSGINLPKPSISCARLKFWILVGFENALLRGHGVTKVIIPYIPVDIEDMPVRACRRAK